MLHRDGIVIRKIIQEIEIGEEMMAETSLEEFLRDEKLKRAVSMTIINVGELIKTITMETRAEYPNVPWKDAAGLRDIAAHRYQTLRMEDVYHSARLDFPAIKTQLLAILAKEETGFE